MPVPITASLFDLFLHHQSVGCVHDRNGVFLERCFDRTLRLEDPGQLLKSTIARLNEEEVDARQFQEVPKDIEEVILPAGLTESNTNHEACITDVSVL